MKSALDQFQLKGRTAIITGGGGLLGEKHAEAVLEAGGDPVLIDVNREKGEKAAARLKKKHQKNVLFYQVDIRQKVELESLKKEIQKRLKKVDIVINNAARNPSVTKEAKEWSRLENFPEKIWDEDLAVGLKGAFLCAQVFGAEMARKGGGVIVNIASDLGIIAPDQRIYRRKGVKEEKQPVKPISYSVVKHGLIGLTKYLATYWAEKNVRVNALCPGGVYTGQPQEFVKKLTQLIPLGRMAEPDEYKAALLFLISDASSYMTGAALVVDGGRSCW